MIRRPFLLVAGAVCSLLATTFLAPNAGEAQKIPGTRPRFNLVLPKRLGNLGHFKGLRSGLPRLTRMPNSRLKREGAGGFQPQLSTDSILYTQRVAISSLSGATTYAWDTVWGFPTSGYDPTTDSSLLSIFPNTAMSAAPAFSNTAHISLGQIGKASLISRLRFTGLMAPLDALGNIGDETPANLLIVVFDGVDFADPDSAAPSLPSNAKIALTNALDENGDPIPAAFVVGVQGTFGGYSFDLDADPTTTPPTPDSRIRITDPNGRFGLLIARIDDPDNPDDPGPEVQWFNVIGVQNGPNLVYSIANGSFTGMGLTTIFADTDFNHGKFVAVQGGNALTNPPLNYLFALQGRELNGSAASRGNLAGNVRLRGVNLPAPDAIESAPLHVALDFFEATPADQPPGNFLMTREVYTQPSYDALGRLLNNIRIDGLEARTYDIIVRNLPILSLNASNQIITNSNWDTSKWPFNDFYPTLIKGVTVTPRAVTSTNSGGVSPLTTLVPIDPTSGVRLERFADIAGSGDPLNPTDGIIDLFDLVALFDSFGANANPPDGPADPDFNPLADLTGADPDQLGDPNPFGFPDGIVDLFDLVALFNQFGLGDVEVP